MPLLAAGALLSGCSREARSEVQEALDFRTALLAAERCAFSADVSADFGERVCDFTLSCAYEPEADRAELTVSAPESIAGISAAVEGAEAQVSFDEVSLELGTTAGGHLAPLRLPQLLGSAWAYGYVEAQAKEGDGWLVSYRLGSDEEALLCQTWFTAQMTPVAAEIYSEGLCVLRAELENFSTA